MSGIPVAWCKRPSYENVVVDCPSCAQEIAFNRASDLRTFEPIVGRDVSCPSCGKPFRIVGDTLNSAHETLVYGCHDLLDRKQHMHCVLTLAQAYEVFFSLSLRVELLFRPFAEDPDRDVNTLNGLSELLLEKVKRHTFVPMRALFLRGVLTPRSLSSLQEAEAAIRGLPDAPTEPRREELERISDAQLRQHVIAVKGTTIHELRNLVVHKRAYRPTLQEVEVALTEARRVLLPLTTQLDLRDDPNWYVTLKARPLPRP